MSDSFFADAAALAGISARLALDVVFLEAGVHALRDREGFSAIVQAYRLLPERASGAFALLVPPLEIAAAIAISMPPTAGFGCVLGIVLMLCFTAAIAINLWRGNRNIDCGCGGGRAQKLSWALVARNLVLLGLLGFCLGRRDAPLPLSLYAGAAGFGVFLILLYFAANQLLSNAQALRDSATGRPA